MNVLGLAGGVLAVIGTGLALALGPEKGSLGIVWLGGLLVAVGLEMVTFS